MSIYRLTFATALVTSLAGLTAAQAQSADPVDQEVVVTAKRLDSRRDAIAPSLGAGDYVIDQRAIATQPQGGDRRLNQVLLQTPGASQDSYGQLHIRNEHSNLQYRINGIILPEGISGFGQTIDTRLADTIDLLTGTLPAQYGYRTSGVVNITTKSGAFDQGATVGMYGGSRGTFQPSLQISGSTGSLNYYVSGSYLRNDIGVENPTSSMTPIHDTTEQGRGFAYLSKIISDETRISAILGSYVGFFEIPNNPGQVPAFSPLSTFNSASLNQRQREVNHYAIFALQGAGENFDYQIAPFTRYSETRYTPDPVGDLIFNGFADRSRLTSWSSGIQADASYTLSEVHTLRGGLFFSGERTTSRMSSDALINNPAASTIPGAFVRIEDSKAKTGFLYGLYLQDEWTITPDLTLNFGGRFDAVNAYTSESQISPRINLVWKSDDDTAFHIGYARNFTPPPQELIPSQSIAKYAGTTKAPEVLLNDVVRAEREHYFDGGVIHAVLPGLDVGFDAYYKIKRNLLDNGRFGESLVLSPFNYGSARAYGVELTSSYHNGPLSTYANVAYGKMKAKNIVSSQFFFDPDELAYIRNNAIFTDHSQNWTISGGANYRFTTRLGNLNVSTDMLFGSGLRRTGLNGVPNGESLPAYTQVNLGVAQNIEIPGSWSGTTVRFDIINLFDESYQIRDGSGVGVGAPQYGPRRAFYAGITKQL